MSSRLAILKNVSYIKSFSTQLLDPSLVLFPFGNYGVSSLEVTVLVKKSIYEFCSRLGLSFIIDRSSIIGRIIGQKFVGWIEDVWDDSKLKELDQPICRQFSYGPYL